MAKKKDHPARSAANSEQMDRAEQETQKLPKTEREPSAPEKADKQQEPSERLKLSDKARTTLFIVLGIAVGAAIAIGVYTILLSAHTSDKAQQLEAGQTELEQKVEEHSHTWVPNYATVHHDAVYKDVWHEPVYESEMTYHTVCNDCKKTIDGIAADHIADTGHSGYSTNVPITNEVLKQAGYSEPVLVSEGWDETVVEGVTCTGCGAAMTAQQAADAGVSIPDAQS